MDQDEIRFLLHEVVGGDRVYAHPRYAHLDRETVDGVLDSAAAVAERYFAPHNRTADLNEPNRVDGKVVLIPEVAQACRAYIDAGFMRLQQDLDEDGMQVPWSVAMAATTFFQAANISTQAYLTLTAAAGNLLAAHASDEQKRRYLLPMREGRFFGTMALSEPQAGSSLADIRTTATPHPDGSYALTGTKQWISGGEHELSENIVHLVLAKIKGAPSGVRGISLFIVPRYRVNDDGSLGADNDVRLVSLLHKMGYRGITSTILSFGENGGCQGFLIGEPHHGLKYMFLMMNEARIGVGLSAASLAYAGYRYSLDYAQTRLQGRAPDAKDPDSPMIPIIEHADVRHMLLRQKCYAEGGLALALDCAALCDDKEIRDEPQRQDIALLLDLLTPIAKAWPSAFCLESSSLAIQILAGYGYTRDYPVEQYYRDNRLNPIHEGTNGIQGLDLLGRKVMAGQGRALQLLGERIAATVAAAQAFPQLRSQAQQLQDACDLVTRTTTQLFRIGTNDPKSMLADSSEYLTLFGHTVVAWIWLRQAIAAAQALVAGAGVRGNYYRGKLAACRYFYRWELPKIAAIAATLVEPDATILELDPECLCP